MSSAPLPLRVGRVTKFLPRMRGLSALLRMYQRMITPGAKFRIDDFDGDLKLRVTIKNVGA